MTRHEGHLVVGGVKELTVMTGEKTRLDSPGQLDYT